MTQSTQPPKTECSAFCPKCKADLYFLDGICYCKNPECDYKCDKCRTERGHLYFSDGNEKQS